MSYSTELAKDYGTPIYIIEISGIPWAFSTHPAAALAGFTVKPYLKPQSITEAREGWDLRSGTGSSGSLSFDIANKGNEVSLLFATDYYYQAETWLAENQPYGNAAVNLMAYDTTDFIPARFLFLGVVFIGLETFFINGAIGVGIFNNCSRAQYNSFGYKHLIVGATVPEVYSNPLITTWPRWDGRYITLHEGFLLETGQVTPLEVIWRGLMNSFEASEDGLHYHISCQSLLEVANRKLGEFVGKAELYRSDENIITYKTPPNIDLLLQVNTMDPAPGLAGAIIRWWPNRNSTYFDLASVLGLGQNCSNPVFLWPAPGGIDFSVYWTIQEGEQRACIYNPYPTLQLEVSLPVEGMYYALGFDEQSYVIEPQTALIAENRPSPVYYGRTAMEFALEQEGNTITLPGTTPDLIVNHAAQIHVKNRISETKEVVTIESVPAWPWLLTLGARGYGVDVAGPITYPIWSDEDEPLIIKQILYTPGILAWQLMLYLLASCDGSGFNGQGDVLPEGWGAELPEAYIDTDSFRDLGTGDLQSWHIDTSKTLSEIIAPELALQGCMIQTVRGKLTLLRIGTTEASRATTLPVCTKSSMAVKQDRALLINKVVLSSGLNVVTGEYARLEDVAQAVEARLLTLGVGEVKVEHPGLRFADEGGAVETLSSYSQSLFARFQSPYVIESEFKRTRNIWPGDQVTLTHPKAVSPYTGEPGIENALCQVLGMERNYQKRTITLRLWLPTQRKQKSAFAPSARVTAWNPGTGVATVAAHTYCTTSQDIAYFGVGFRVKVVRYNAEAATWEGTITALNVTANTMTLGAGILLSDGNPPAANDRVRFVDYADAALTDIQKTYPAIDRSFHWS